MTPITLSIEQLKEYMINGKRHKCYDDTVKIADRLRLHADGESAGTLISERRPSESEEIQKYRQKIFVAITEGSISKILTCLAKIRKSPDWSIRFDANKQPGGIIEGETLEEYTDKNLPDFTSVTNWMFNLCMKSYLVDPNAVCLVMPIELRRGYVFDAATYVRPIPIVFNSDQVYDYVPEEYALLYSTDKSEYGEGKAKRYDGHVFYFVNTDVIIRYEQTDDKGTMTAVYEYKHLLGELPVFKLKGVVYKTADRTVIFKSRINPIVPRLNEAVREYSDLQAEVVQHVHSTFWYYGGQTCSDCKGLREIATDKGPVKCEKCKGAGRIPLSPFQSIEVAPPSITDTLVNIPTPPAGYVQKNVDIVKVQDERIEKHIWHALSAINMEFLAQVPLSQSGEAKKVDRQEVDTFVNGIAEDIVVIMDRVYYFIAEYRYRSKVSDKRARRDMLPSIAVPDRFDILSSEYLLQEVQAARTAKLNPVSQNALEVEYTNKKFCNDPDVRDMVKAVLTLDPFSGITDDDKLLRLQNKGISQEDYVISCNVFPFVNRAVVETPGFLGLDSTKQREIMKKYAQEKIKENSARANVMGQLDPMPNPNPNNQPTPAV